MGQYTSRLSSTPNADPLNHQPSAPSPLRQPSTPTESQELGSMSTLSNLRRRRSSTNTNSILPPSRRRRLPRLHDSMRFWNRNEGQSGNSTSDADSLRRNVNDFIINEIDSPASNLSANPIQDAIEGSSGSGNIIENNTTAGSRFIDELDDIASDLFSAVSRENAPRMRQFSSVSSLRTTSTSESSNAHNHLQHSHHHHHHNASSTRSNTQNDNDDGGVSFEHQTEMLSRLLEVAATSTVYTLMGTGPTNGRRFDNTTRTTDESTSTESGTSGTDTTFQEFVTALRNGLLTNELGRNSQDTGQMRENMTFFRAFRFDDESHTGGSSTSDQALNTSMNFSLSSHGTTSVEASSTNNNLQYANNSQDEEARMVPVMIVGVRSVQQGTERADPFGTDADGEINLSMTNQGSRRSANATPAQNDRMESSSGSFTSNSSNDSSEEEASSNERYHQRSWVIFVMGNTFAFNHPLLSAPSLMSENPTYEDLLHLQELIGQVKPPVTTKEELLKHEEQLFEVKMSDNFEYKTKYKSFTDITEYDRCQICLTEYEDNEVVRKLTNCSHFYHKGCIDTWLLSGKNNCPLCRTKGISSHSNVTEGQASDNAF